MADSEGPRLTELMTYLIEKGEQGCVEDIFPYLDKAFVGALNPNRLMAINALRSLLQQNLIPSKSFNNKFMEGLLLSMENSDQVVAKAWLDILLDVTELVPIYILKSCILPTAVSMGQLSESVESRVASSELLGKIAARFDSTEIDKEIVPLVQSLCQDVASEVRTSMCHELPVIMKGLSSDDVLLPVIVELAVDEESSVRQAAIQAIADLLPHLKPDVIKDIIVPLFKRICEKSTTSKDNNTMLVIAKNYAHICLGIHFALSQSDKVFFVRFFKQLARVGLKTGETKFSQQRCKDSKLECRYQCAYCFPSMITFGGVKLFEELLFSIYVALVADPFHGIRQSIAGGIHDVMKLLGGKCVQLKPQFIALLNDTNLNVLLAIVPNVADILEQLSRTSAETLADDTSSQQLAQALANCEHVIQLSHNWRAHAAILAQLECVPRVLSADIAQNTFSGVLLERIQYCRPMPCRLAAARTLLVFLRHNVRAEQRTQLRDKIIAELCNNRSCHCRLLFVKMCGMALDIFSSQYFKEHFYLPLLSRARDPIPNIRLLVCRLLPRLKMLLQLPQDSAKLALLDDAVHQLATSKPDPDVIAELSAVRSQLDCITVRTDLASVGVLPRSITKPDEDDGARYEEEFKIAQTENRARKLVTVNLKTLDKGTKPSVIAIPPVENSKLTNLFHVTAEPRRSSDTTSILNNLSSALNECTLSNRSQGLSKSCSSINSEFPTLREDEFYVDAGVSLKVVNVGMSLSSLPTVRDMLDVQTLGSRTSSFSSYSSIRSTSPKLSVTPRTQSVVSLPASSSQAKPSSLPVSKSAFSTKRYSHVFVVDNKPAVPDLKIILGDKKPVTRNNGKVSVTVNKKPVAMPSTKMTSLTVLNRRQTSLGSVPADRRRVALSSIGVRPQSCIAVGSRSLSQESLRGSNGTQSSRLSQIPRGAVSCHSSPTNSRGSSPPRMPQSAALVSRLPVRRDRLSMSK